MAEKKKNGKVLNVLLFFVITLVVIAAAIYIGIGMYFKTHFYPKSTVNQQNVSMAEVATVEDRIKTEAEDYLLAIHERGDNVTYIDGKQIDYVYESDGSIAKLLEAQDTMLWPKYIMRQHDYTVDVKITYDDDKLVKLIEAMDCFKEENITKPEDAYVKNTDDGYEIIPEVAGNEPLMEQILIDVRAAVDSAEAVLTLTDADYVQPAVKSDDPNLTQKIELAEKYRKMTITYKIEGSEQILDGDTIVSWITINDDLTVTVDEAKAAAYAQTLASKYNTYADTRKFKTSKGDSVEIGGGDYGWIIAKAKEATQLVSDIKAGESITREPCYEQRAFVEGTDDIGNTYVEIDYTNQHMYYYREGKLVVEADIVTGNLNNGNGSPDGVFKIITKKSPAVLNGEDYSSDVTYFMPFAYNVGFHDADWRDNFGGTIYKGNGSHGCVNMPFEAAETLFNEVEIGTPVVAYYRDSVKLTSNNAQVSNAYSYTSK